MNTNAISTELTTILAVGIMAIPCASVTADDFIIVGNKGRILSVSNSGGTKQVVPVDVPSLGRRVIETHFEPSEKKLFVTTDDAKLYELDLSDGVNGFQRIQTTNDLLFCIWYDCREKRPAWLHLGGKESIAKVRVHGKDNRIRTSRSDDIEFRKGSIFGMHIDGWKTSSSLARMNSQLAFLTEKYPDDRWMIVGRSKNITVYSRRLANLVKSGEQFKSTCLFHDRKNDKWHLQSFDEVGKVTVYNDVATVQGIYDINGDIHPETGNYIQARPSGKWYFYVPENRGILAHELDPSLTVQYATAKEAVISGDSQVLTIRLGYRVQNEPEILVELPPVFSVSAICPL